MRAKLHAGRWVLMKPAVEKRSVDYETDIHCRLCERELERELNEWMQYQR